MDRIYFEDIEIPGRVEGPGQIVDRDEMIAFAREWDPLPAHTDEAAAAEHGGLSAPGAYLIAFRIRLIHRMPRQHAVIASLGYDEVRFHAPVRPGDRLTIALDYLHKRPSASKPDRGIVVQRQSLINQHGVAAMTLKDASLVLMRRD